MASQDALQLEVLRSKLGHPFQDGELLRLALTHPSATQGSPTENNQRLEFLGDAVLQLVLTAELYSRYPTKPEGVLTKARSRLVNRRALAQRSRELGLGEFLILSKGEELTGGRARASTLADAFEAVLGAMFLDGGFEAARDFIVAQFEAGLEIQGRGVDSGNPKGDLQEWVQATSRDLPEYEILTVKGPDHDREFECIVKLQGEELGRGRERTKKGAESRAARAALEQLKQQIERPAIGDETGIDDPGDPA